MNLQRTQRRGNGRCSQERSSLDHRTGSTRAIYQVDASILCQLVKRHGCQPLERSFSQLLYFSSIDRRFAAADSALFTHAPDLLSVAIHWNSSRCTTSDVEEFVSIIDPLISLHELFCDVPTSSDTRDLIGLICFYGSTIEVFFSYEHSTSRWLFCFDGHITVVSDWTAVRRKCIDCHLQPFLLIYANTKQSPVNISQLLKRTDIQTQIVPCERRLGQTERSMTKQAHIHFPSNELRAQLYSFEQLAKISSFATLNSSMLFLPQSSTSSSSSYINHETVAKVMQQQLLKKELLSETSSRLSSSSVPCRDDKYKYDDVFCSENSSTSSQRDSGLSSGMNDASSDASSRHSVAETDIDTLMPQQDQLVDDDRIDRSLVSVDYHFEQSLKYENEHDYASALESCQRALSLVDQILNLTHHDNHGLAIYVRTKKNGLLMRKRSLKQRLIEQESSPGRTTGSRKKTVTFSDEITFIVPSVDEITYSFSSYTQEQTSSSDSDSETSSADIPIGLSECSLCRKRCSLDNALATLCANCHYYMQRFQPSVS